MLHYQQSITLLFLALFCTLSFNDHISLVQAEEIVTSSTGVRGASKNTPPPTISHQSSTNVEEDDSPVTKNDQDSEIEALKKELKWGMQEMARYQSVRGAWPVRNPDHGWSASHVAQREEQHNKLADEMNYWNMLLSVF